MDPITLGIIGLGAYLLFRPRSHRIPGSSASQGFTYRRKGGSWRAYFD